MAKHDSMAPAKPVQSVAEELAELGSHAGEVAREQYERLKADAAELAKDGRERVNELEQSLERYIVGHPIKSMLIAVGVGIVFGRCILR